jgi:hypothetical protein
MAGLMPGHFFASCVGLGVTHHFDSAETKKVDSAKRSALSRSPPG